MSDIYMARSQNRLALAGVESEQTLGVKAHGNDGHARAMYL
jgi:hypothetical protein